jgi:hypothetical protein
MTPSVTLSTSSRVETDDEGKEGGKGGGGFCDAQIDEGVFLSYLHVSLRSKLALSERLK